MAAALVHRREEAEIIPESADLPIRSILPETGARPAVAVSSLQARLLQRRIQPVGEEQLKALEDSGQEVDPGYLDGLYFSSGNQLFLYAGQISERLVDAKGDAERKVQLFAQVDTVSEEKLDEILDDPRKLILVSEDEKHTVTGGELIARGNSEIKAGFGTQLVQELIDRILSGEPKGGAGGDYGSIEFRFKRAAGKLYTSLDEEQLPDERVQARYGGAVEVVRISAEDLLLYINIYQALNLPYQAERIGFNSQLGPYSLFLAEGFDYVTEYESVAEATEVGEDGSHFQLLVSERERTAGGEIKPSIEAPGAAPKLQNKSYVRTAVRGDRGTGQKAAMNNQSAAEYVASVVGADAKTPALSGWEWLHLQGSRLGGKNVKENLVAGTYSANSRMIPVEREILALSRDANAEHPVNVHWEASLQEVGGELTHIGERISINVEAPKGTAKSASAVRFSYSFDVTEGEAFTKLDRDKLDLLSKQSGGHPTGKNPLLDE